ncbi:MAG: enoyl-CoA hydratase [Deltaproteobacteria bacterium]|nr:enoyl-CoA hydratase [Deltaproteobacteria bacterium]
MTFDTIRYEQQERVVTITLSRPDRLNAFNLTMARELRAAWVKVKRDADVVCVVLTGAGDRAFCTGMDVADVAQGETQESAARTRDESPWCHLTAVQNRCWKPVITAVNGMVCGGGLHFIADSDLILCSETATFFDTHVKVGLVGGLEPVSLARRLPLEAVLRMALLGGAERVDARRAYEIGLVGEVVAPDMLLPRAHALAAAISQHSPTALARTKRAIWESLDVGLDEALERTWRIIQEHNDHPDLKEGSRAFVEKRRPRWARGGE